MDILLDAIEIDIENGDYSDVETYGEIIERLQKLFKSEHIKNIIKAYEQLKDDVEDWLDFEAIRHETLNNTGDEYLAEDVAWELVYAR